MRNKSIEIIDAFKENYSNGVHSFNFENASDRELDEFQIKMFKMIEDLEDKLMGTEMKLIEVLSTALSDFNTKIEAINSEMGKINSDFCKDVNELDNKFRTELREHAYKLHDDFIKDSESGHTEKWESELDLTALLYEKETMTQYFELAKDFQEQKINEIELAIRIAIKTDWTDTRGNLENQQHNRNRSIIAEIINMTEEKKAEITNMIRDAKDRY